MPGRAGGDSRSQALQLVEDHVLREESDLFPAAHQRLGSDAWAVIAASVGDPGQTDGQRSHTEHHNHDRHDGDREDETRRDIAPAAD